MIQNLIDDTHWLIATLPARLQQAVIALADAPALLEVIMDLGRPAQARFVGGAITLGPQPVSREELEQVVDAVGAFGADNRAGIEGTLHRISAIRNRKGEVVGLTLRVGRAVIGTIDAIRDLVESGSSVLLLGRPGVGKTTKLREVARVLADDCGKRVVVVDTSNEIGGDGDVPHPAIGSARRMQVGHPDQQHGVMIEAVENHMPEVVIVDEIGTAAEAAAARTIAERGVQLIATAHGNTLENLVLNPTLSDLVGGVQTVTLGDDEARFRGTQKTVSERKAPPTFDAVVEIVNREEVVVHAATADAVDMLLRGAKPEGARRHNRPGPAAGALPESPPALGATASEGSKVRITGDQPLPPPSGIIQIYPYAVSKDSLERVIRDLGLDARAVNRPERANFVVSLRSRAEDPRLQRLLDHHRMPVHTVKKNTTAQLRRLLQALFYLGPGATGGEAEAAAQEAEGAIRRLMDEGGIIALAPRPAPLRKLQHRIAARYHLLAESVGREPQRHLVISAPPN